MDLSRLRGLLAYEPEEFVFTAFAGTPVAEVEEALRAHGQYLPFHPPLAGKGATLGGRWPRGYPAPCATALGGLETSSSGCGSWTGREGWCGAGARW
ncbi:FAD linked oxidase domain-containing protein [Thermus thermophilus]|nr:FAD linked oxidase domain-containing protein [Thermus thermophilus]